LPKFDIAVMYIVSLHLHMDILKLSGIPEIHYSNTFYSHYRVKHDKIILLNVQTSECCVFICCELICNNQLQIVGERIELKYFLSE